MQFESFNPNSVIGIYAFILTAGDFDDNDHSSSLDQLYTDIWGTSYEAGLRVLKQHIKRHIKPEHPEHYRRRTKL